MVQTGATPYAITPGAKLWQRRGRFQALQPEQPWPRLRVLRETRRVWDEQKLALRYRAVDVPCCYERSWTAELARTLPKACSR